MILVYFFAFVALVCAAGWLFEEAINTHDDTRLHGLRREVDSRSPHAVESGRGTPTAGVPRPRTVEVSE